MCTADTLVNARREWGYGALGKVQVLLAPGGCFLDFQDAPFLQEARATRDGEMAVEEGATEWRGSPKRQVLHE